MSNITRMVVDSCVLIAAAKKKDAFHEQSKQFIRQATNDGNTISIPMTALWEIGAALDHPHKRPLGSQLDKQFSLHVKLIAVDEGLFNRTWIAGLRQVVKGADRIFLSCAMDEAALLITWDTGLKNTAAAFGVTAMTPTEYLASAGLR